MSYLVFPTQQLANEALAVINTNMGFPNSQGTTTTWAVPYLSVDNTWVFEKPDVEYMTNVPETYIETETPPQRYVPPFQDE
jgi:hypothetical protein